MKFLLTSAGLRNEQIALALEELVGKPLTETTLLFIPTAANTGTDDKGWMIDDLRRFQEFKFSSIDVVDIAVGKEIWEQHLLLADVICFGGGDEQYLARVIVEQGMKQFLLPLLTRKVYMGISAGSMVVGNFLPQILTRQLFPEEDFGSQVAESMKLLDLVFIPHMNSSWFKHVRREKLEELKKQFHLRTYCTDDETALKIDGNNVSIVGTGESWEFTP